MKVGDLVRHFSIIHHGQLDEQIVVGHGLVIQLAPSVGSLQQALVLFMNGKLDWISETSLEIINESR